MKYLRNLIAAFGVLTSRFVGLPANFSPLGSFGFFGSNQWFFAAVIIIHDYLRGGFYPGFWLTYVGFAMYAVLGKLAKNRWQLQIGLLPLASLLFFVFSNLGVWWYWYPRTIDGLLSCYFVALPFLRNTLLGDLSFGYGYLVLRLAAKQIKFPAQQLAASSN